MIAIMPPLSLMGVCVVIDLIIAYIFVSTPNRVAKWIEQHRERDAWRVSLRTYGTNSIRVAVIVERAYLAIFFFVITLLLVLASGSFFSGRA